MIDPMVKIHQDVFNLLLDFRKEDSDLMFTFRQINRKGRLDKGYWFLGDESYLALSFWRGKDWITKVPRISFIVNVNGTTGLYLSSKDTSSYGAFFHEDLVKKLELIPIGNDYGFTRDYIEFEKSYLESLKAFIKNEKIIIDNAISQYKCFYASEVLEFTDGIETIWPGDFKKQYSNIINYQTKKVEERKRSGFLKSITIKDFGNISNLTINNISDDSRWIFFTGENGSGKSTILKAIATALCRNNDNEERVAIGFGEYKLRVGVRWGNKIEEEDINLVGNHKGKKIIPNGFAAYGPIRLLSESSIGNKLMKIEIEAIVEKMTYGLFNPIGVLRDLKSPYILMERSKYLEMAIDDFLENLSYIVPNVAKVEYKYSGKDGQLFFYEKKGDANINEVPIPFDKLPSGTRSFAALIIDLLIRFKHQQPEVTDPSAYNGIVLIDEIDLHLHPKMQKEMVVQLSDTFPNVQFIVTTHSPIPLLGAPPNSVFIKVYSENDEVKVERYDDKIPIQKLLPTALLGSPLFDLDDYAPIDKEINEILTQDNYEDALYHYLLRKKFKKAND